MALDYSVKMEWLEDLAGFHRTILNKAGIVPSGVPDDSVSQYFQSLAKLFNREYSSVQAAINAIEGDELVIGSIIKTTSYYDDWGGHTPRGGNLYVLLQAEYESIKPEHDGGSVIHIGDDKYLFGLFPDGVYVDQFGAKGYGGHFDQDKIQAAIDYFYKLEIPGEVLFDGEACYLVNSYFIPRPRVSMRGVGSKPTIKSLNPVGGGYGDILLPGNFHPHFTQDFTYYPAMTPTEKTRTITIQEQGGRFLEGDQVFIVSTDKGFSGGLFQIPLYGWLNIVENVDGDAITLRYPVDYITGIEVAALKDEVCRGDLGAFFYYDATVSNIRFESAGGWISDSAMLDVSFVDVEVSGTRGIYGNSFQKTKWLNSSFRCSSGLGEQSHNSLDTLCDNCEFTHTGLPDVASNNGLSIQEYARNIVFSNFRIYGSSYASGKAIIKTINTRNVRFSKGIVDVQGSLGVSLIQLGDGDDDSQQDSDFLVSDNVVNELSLTAQKCGRFALIYCAEYSTRNGILNSTFNSEEHNSECVRIHGVGPCENSTAFIESSRFNDGDFVLTGDSGFNYKVSNSFIGSGFSTEGSTDPEFLERGVLSGLSSLSSESRRGFRRFLFDVSAKNEKIIDLVLGESTMLWDTYKLRGFFRSQGNSRDRKIEIYLVDNTDSSESLIADFTVLAADALVNCELGLIFQPKSSGANASVTFSRSDLKSVTAINYYNTNFLTSHNYSIRLDSVIGTGAGDEGNSSWQIPEIRSEIISSVYNY